MRGFRRGGRSRGKITIEPDARRSGGRSKWLIVGMRSCWRGRATRITRIIGTTKHHFDDVEEAEAALRQRDEERSPELAPTEVVIEVYCEGLGIG